MRLTRSSSQTGARTSTVQAISPQVRKNPPSTESPAKASKRTRKSATSTATTSSEQNDPSPPKPIQSNLHPPNPSNPSTPASLTRRQGARKSRQNVRINQQISTFTAILKDSSVTANSSRGSSTKQQHSSPHDTNSVSNNNNNCTSGLSLRGKKKQITKNHSNGTGSQFFDVEDILDVKLEEGRYLYLIKWRGYPDSDNTWEPEHNLSGDLLDFYYKKSHVKANREKNETASVTRDNNNCDLGNVNRENTRSSSHSRVNIGQQGSRCKTATSMATESTDGRLRINCPLASPVSSSYESESFLLAACPESNSPVSNAGEDIDEANECLPCSSFQANSPPESYGSIGIDSPKSGSSISVQHETSSNVRLNFDPLSLCNLKRVVTSKAGSSSISSQYANFELNDSLVPGKVVCIDKSPFGTGKVALIKWIDHEPTTWLDYDFVKLKYPDLLMDFYEEMLVIDSTLPQ